MPMRVLLFGGLGWNESVLMAVLSLAGLVVFGLMCFEVHVLVWIYIVKALFLKSK